MHNLPHTVISLQPAERAAALGRALQGSPVAFFNLPMIYTETVPLTKETEQKLRQLPQIDLLVFTSRNGVKSFFSLLKKTGISLPVRTKIAVIGHGTAGTLEQLYRPADFIQPGITSADFIAYLQKEVLDEKQRIMLALGNLAPDRLENGLKPFATVQRINVYQTFPVKTYDKSLMQAIEENRYGLLVVSSPSAFYRFHELYHPRRENPLRMVSIGQITTGAVLKKEPQAVVLTAKKPGTEGLLNEIKKYFHLKN